MLQLNTKYTKSSAQNQEILIFENKYLCILFAVSNLRAVLKTLFCNRAFR